MTRYQLGEEGRAAIAQMHADPTVLSVTPDSIRLAGKQQIQQLQAAALLGDRWGYIAVPPELQHARKKPPVDLRKLLCTSISVPSQELDTWLLETTRLAVCMALLPGVTGVYYKHTTIHSQICAVCRFVRDGSHIDGPHGFWSRYVIEEVAKSRGAVMLSICSVINHYYAMGALADGLALREKPQGSDGPRDRTGEPEHSQAPRSPNPIQPYSDELISAAGRAAIVMIRRVGPVLIEAVDAALRVPIPPPRIGPSGEVDRSSLSRRKALARDPIIASWDWLDSDGKPVVDIGLEFKIKQGRSRVKASWPPRTLNHAMRMISILQGAHFFPVALSVGTRAGEMISMEVGLLKDESCDQGVLDFRSWKMEQPGGVVREAPVPKLAIEAIKQQERLASMLKEHHGVSSNNLWVSLKDPANPPMIGFMLMNFLETLSLDHLLGSGGANQHRFRKTLARIVALAIVHAPKVLMDVFGHRDEEITVVRYILSDPSIVPEIQIAVQELVILSGVEAITNSETMQGAGAPKLRERVAQYAQRLGKSALEPQNALEFARALTQEGTSWAIIAPGVLCMNFKEGGLCNKGQGRANPHYCDPRCENQLNVANDVEEFKAVVVRSIETVEYSLQMALSASEQGDNMAFAQFVGQIRSLLGRWKEVDEYFEDSGALRELLGDRRE